LRCNGEKVRRDAEVVKWIQESNEARALVLSLQDEDDTPRSMSALYQNFFDIGGAAGAADKAYERRVHQFVLRLLQSGLNVWHDLTLLPKYDMARGND
jgi:hypothetical protein